MQFIIKPNDASLNLLLEAGQYQRMWQQHSRTVMRAFRENTGLAFQQRVITARVYADNTGNAGTPHHPMHLPADYQSEKVKLITLVHELAHRLLGGNALGPVALGLIPDTTAPHPEYQEYEHRHTYLFEYDVIERALGQEYAELCREQEEGNNIDGPHDRAWAWAMSMSYAHRQAAVKQLASQALPRDRWHEQDGVPIQPRDAALWFASLGNTVPASAD